ncbi:PQQ-dependent sugar dehydrogenase [Pseudoroseicyclus aestuarii]|uniref:Glucose/arabinose dehydrogenase n=1 Tax=Pseudoroseicyclus aestuarii TaxID=1795041 RepID=A0A318SX30_9RHOB|nr:PQQ-dependent sugar dehydrogenase [Pseudoroseicyclus aestuarii]PYE84387.1 glucose/arabinose dehydrogenase [Pseudoroseicyclus aestuarii]
MTTRLTLALAALLPACAAAQDAVPTGAPVEQGPKNADFEPAFENQTRAPALAETAVSPTTVVDGLVHPWGIAPLPEGGWLVTERAGRLRVLGEDGSLSEPLSGLPQVDAREQGGMLDVTTGPDFGSDRMVYFTYSKQVEGGTVTAVARGTLAEDLSGLSGVEDIFLQTPPADTPAHYGSRLMFDGEGHLFVSMGEHFSDANRQLAQDNSTTYGKVIRILPDGSIPEGNPQLEGWEPAIWSTGHRNPQGLAMDADGQLWEIEHGPAGGDELNLVEPGLNYGWPEVSYGLRYDGGAIGSAQARAEGFEEPVYYWDPVIAPSGAQFYDADAFEGWEGDLLIASLRPGGVVRLQIKDGRVVGEERIATDLGRVRDVEVAPNGDVLALTDYDNGAVVRISPAQ